MSYYKDILFQTESVFIKPIYDRRDESKVLYHSFYIKQIISQDKWGNHPSDLQLLETSNQHFNHYDYIEAWDKVFLYQNESFSHSWFVQFDQKFKSQIPLWFTDWWNTFGPVKDIMPEALLQQMRHFIKNRINKNPDYAGYEDLHFFSKYKIPWITKWQFKIATPIDDTTTLHTDGSRTALVTQHDGIKCVARVHYVKWWDKFNINRIAGQVQLEFPIVNPKPEKKCEEASTTSLDVSSIDKMSTTELNKLLKAIQQRTGSLKNEDSKEKSVTDSQGSSQNSVTNPYGDEFQDAQDPYQ